MAVLIQELFLALMVAFSLGAPLPKDIQLSPSFEMSLKAPTASDLTNFGTNQEEDSFELILQENAKIHSGMERYLLEGDILVSNKVGKERVGTWRNALLNRNFRWPGGVVPYIIDGDFDAGARQRIQAAMNRYHETTCIRFIARNDHRDYVRIVPRQGCFSAVGRQGGRQDLSVGGDCNRILGIIMHELMHAIGFYHEQTRTDRDQFVTVYWQNIERGYEDQFNRYEQDTIDHLQTSYDYNSIMHYPPNAFSVNGRPTILPKQSGVVIGNREDFSTTDILKINRYYGCDGTTGVATGGGEEEDSCIDKRGRACAPWVRRGYCSGQYAAFMRENCRRSCNLCN